MTKVRKVTLITSRLELRGSAASTLHLARGLVERDIDVQVICRGGALTSQFEAEGIRPKVLEIYGDSPLNVFTWPKLLKLLRDHSPDLLHFQHPHLGRLARLLGWWLEIPYAYTIHSSPPPKITYPPPWLLGVIAVSEGVREELVNRTAVPREIVAVIEDGVEVHEPDYDPEPAERKAIPVIGAMNRLDGNRGLRYLILAARKLLDRGSPVHVVIVGEGPDEYALRRLIREQGLTESVTITHPSGDYRKILALFDVFVSVSLTESLGIFCLEAMALGKPVIATAVGGVFQYLKDGHNGLFIPPRDSGTLADRIELLIDRPELCHQLGVEAKKLVSERYPVSRTIDRTIEFYEAVLDRAEDARALAARS
ncbi:MAG: glycosyltransferase family 4 protein [Planctomycetes bacterium]|nr:glycosyltransferase family 4 protein [Planctomycetota bacterium]